MSDLSVSRSPAIGRFRSDPAFRLTLWILAGVTFLRICWLAGKPFDLYPDEAQYWIWAQHPAFGYFSKPPMIAWMISLTTILFGDDFLGVKIASPITYLFTGLVVHAIGRRLYDARVGLWAAVAFITLPSVSLSSAIISTDVPLLFFWAAASYALIRAREEGASHGWWVLVGISAGLGLLSKYAMGFWLGSALIYLLAVPEERRHLRAFFGAAVLALVILMPNIVWNLHNGLATFHATGANADLHGGSIHPVQFLEFAGAQFGVFGPVFLATLILIVARDRTIIRDRRTLLLLSLSIPTLAVMLVESALARAHPNWSAPAYVTATVLVVAWLEAKGKDLWVQWSVVLHIALAVALFGAGEAAHAIGHPLPGKLDPLHRVKGWAVLGRSVSDLRAEAPQLSLLADERELMAALIYYMHPHPFEMKIWNPAGHVKNGFEMTQSLPDKPGGDYLWITSRSDKKELFDRFERHVEIAHVLVPLGPGLSREVWAEALLKFRGYRDAPATTPGNGSASQPAPTGG